MAAPATKKHTSAANAASSWPKAKTKNAKRKTASKGKPAKVIEGLLKEEKWQDAQALLHKELIHAPTDHWWWMMLGLTYYELLDYDTALECAKRAVELAPQCPLALWHCACSLSMTGQERAALAAWSLILNRDLEETAYGECGEGMKWAMQLVNDVHYRMGVIHEFLGEDVQAKASFSKYLHNRGHGVGSLYDLGEVKKRLANLSPAIH